MCGKCCMGMGRYVKITGMIGQNRYAVQHTMSGEFCYATVEPRFRNEIKKGEDMGWCPFLCEVEEDGCRKYYCAIYDTAPKFCKDFQCCRARILDANGTEKGEIKGRRTLVTEDENLKEIWDSNKEVNDITDEAKWAEMMGEILKNKGYSLVVYE